MKLSDILPEHVAEVENIIFKYLPHDTGYASTIEEAMEYSLKAGGKRLRPMLILETGRKFLGNDTVLSDEEDFLRLAAPFMAALEMIHTYSLVHDDLPAMDNDTLRRGKPTTWAAYGDGMAVLAGDALLNFAFETAMLSFDNLEGFDTAHKAELLGRCVKALKVLGNKAGIYGMVGGQVADVEAEKKHIPLNGDRLIFIHEKKTGALLQAAFMIGGILAGADDAEIEILSRAALEVGVAFQIQDDILDVIGDEKLLGKNIGSDVESGKETYVTLYGFEKAKGDVKELSERAIGSIVGLAGENEFLVELVKSLVEREY